MRKAQIIGALLITLLLLILVACPSPTEPAPTPENSLTAPKLLSPHNRAIDVQPRPVLLWEAVPEAKGYKLTVSRNSDFSDTVIDVLSITTSQELSKDLVPSTQYYWMVCAKLEPANPDTPTACSEVWTFTTAEETEPEPEPTPVRPPLPEPSPPSSEPIEITAAQLSTEYDEVGLVAETQYKYQLLEVSGTFDYFGIAAGLPFISFETDPDAWEIRAFLSDDQEVSKAQTLAKGDEIVVTGTCQGTTWYRIILGECKITIP
jgi:hypothetical protein